MCIDKCGQVLVTCFKGSTSACNTEWCNREPHGKDGQQRGPRLGIPVPGQCVDEWDGQSRHASNDQRGGTALTHPHTHTTQHTAHNTHSVRLFVKRFAWVFGLFVSWPGPIRSSPKRLRSTSGRGNTRSVEWRSWKWGEDGAMSLLEYYTVRKKSKTHLMNFFERATFFSSHWQENSCRIWENGCTDDRWVGATCWRCVLLLLFVSICFTLWFLICLHLKILRLCCIGFKPRILPLAVLLPSLQM